MYREYCDADARKAAKELSVWAVVALGGRSFTLHPDIMDTCKACSAMGEKTHVLITSFPLATPVMH